MSESFPCSSVFCCTKVTANKLYKRNNNRLSDSLYDSIPQFIHVVLSFKRIYRPAGLRADVLNTANDLFFFCLRYIKHHSQICKCSNKMEIEWMHFLWIKISNAKAFDILPENLHVSVIVIDYFTGVVLILSRCHCIMLVQHTCKLAYYRYFLPKLHVEIRLVSIEVFCSVIHVCHVHIFLFSAAHQQNCQISVLPQWLA